MAGRQAGIWALGGAASVLGDSSVQALPASPHPLRGWEWMGDDVLWLFPVFHGREPIFQDILPKLEAPGRLNVQTPKIYQEKEKTGKLASFSPGPPRPPSTTAVAVWVVPGREE